MSTESSDGSRVASPATTFESLGFVHEGGVKWRRDADGRTWRLTFMPQRRTKYSGEVRIINAQGWRLRIDTTTSAMVRAYAVRRSVAQNGLLRRIHRFRRLEHVPLAAPADAFVMVTSDAAWTRQLLASPEVLAAFSGLAEYRQAAGASASVYFDPASMHYASPLLQVDDVTTDRVASTLNGLMTLARAADRLPPPALPSTLNAAERLMRDHPYMVVIGFFAVGLAVLALGSLVLMVLAWMVLG